MSFDNLPPDMTRRRRGAATPVAASTDPNALDPGQLLEPDGQDEDLDEEQRNARRRAFLELSRGPAIGAQSRNRFLER